MATIDVTDPAREVLNQAPPLQPINCSRSTSRCARRSSARAAAGESTARARRAGSPAASRRASTAAARSATSRSSVPTIATATASTRSSSTRRGTGCSTGRSSARSTGSRGASSEPGAHVVRAALFALWGNANDGVMCPVSMTYAAIPALRDGAPELAAEWEPRLTKPDYEARRARRDGDDRAPGRLGRARQHHARRAARRRRLRAARPQVVLLVSAVRRVPRARAGAGRAVVLPRRARSGDGVPAAQGQARHPLAAVIARSSSAASRRGWSARRAAACRRSSGWSTTPGSTACSAASTGHAPRHARGDPPRPPPRGVRGAARRPAGDAERARRPRARVRGGDGRGDAGRAQLRRARRRRLPPVRHRGDEVLGLQARRRRTRPRRSSASAATASSRTRGCRCCTATRR